MIIVDEDGEFYRCHDENGDRLEPPERILMCEVLAMLNSPSAQAEHLDARAPIEEGSQELMAKAITQGVDQLKQASTLLKELLVDSAAPPQIATPHRGEYQFEPSRHGTLVMGREVTPWKYLFTMDDRR